jgi:hypothetical protein
MRTLTMLAAAGTLAYAAGSPETPGSHAPAEALAALQAEAALKCYNQRRPQREQILAMLLDGAVLVEPHLWGDVDTGGVAMPPSEELAASHMICQPEFEALGVDAEIGFYFLTRDTGAHLLRESLREVYALQEAHWEAHGRWAGSLEDLGYTLPHPDLRLEIEVRADGEMWTGQGTHAMDLLRCSIYGWGALRSPAAVEKNSTPTCARLAPDDEAFPRGVAARGTP